MKEMEHKECVSALIPVRDTLELIGRKWTLLVLISVWEGNKRFREIERSIPGLSAKVLADELKQMEMNKLIIKSELNGSPVRTEYRATEYSHKLKKVINALQEWGQSHRREIFGV